jgi:carboxymethylenebutenolidase
MPDDIKIEHILRTLGKDQVVDELILKFTHEKQIDFKVPGIAPTGMYVELPHVAVMKFSGNKICMSISIGIRHHF